MRAQLARPGRLLSGGAARRSGRGALDPERRARRSRRPAPPRSASSSCSACERPARGRGDWPRPGGAAVVSPPDAEALGGAAPLRRQQTAIPAGRCSATARCWRRWRVVESRSTTRRAIAAAAAVARLRAHHGARRLAGRRRAAGPRRAVRRSAGERHRGRRRRHPAGDPGAAATAAPQRASRRRTSADCASCSRSGRPCRIGWPRSSPTGPACGSSGVTGSPRPPPASPRTFGGPVLGPSHVGRPLPGVEVRIGDGRHPGRAEASADPPRRQPVQWLLAGRRRRPGRRRLVRHRRHRLPPRRRAVPASTAVARSSSSRASRSTRPRSSRCCARSRPSPGRPPSGYRTSAAACGSSRT